jgi:hypothetical protein
LIIERGSGEKEKGIKRIQYERREHKEWKRMKRLLQASNKQLKGAHFSTNNLEL